MKTVHEPRTRTRKRKRAELCAERLELLEPACWSYFETTCASLHEYVQFLPGVLDNCDVDRVLARLRLLLRAIGNPGAFDELYRTPDGTLRNGFLARPGDTYVGRHVVYIRTPSRRNNSGTKGGSLTQCNWQQTEKWVPPVLAGRYTYRPYNITRVVGTRVRVDQRTMQCAGVPAEQGGGRRDAPLLRRDFTNERGVKYTSCRVALYTGNEAVEGAYHALRPIPAHVQDDWHRDGHKDVRPPTLEELALYRTAWDAVSSYYTITWDKAVNEETKRWIQQRFTRKTLGSDKMVRVSYEMTHLDLLHHDLTQLLMLARSLAAGADMGHYLSGERLRLYDRCNSERVRKMAARLRDLETPARDLVRDLETPARDLVRRL
jgi:hypothetical protein